MYKISLLVFLPLLASENSRPTSGLSRLFRTLSRSSSVSSPSPVSSGRSTPANLNRGIIKRERNADGSITVTIDGSPINVSKEAVATISSCAQTPVSPVSPNTTSFVTIEEGSLEEASYTF